MSRITRPRAHANYHVGMGPLDASMVRDGDYVELSNGHRIQCQPAGKDHGVSNLAGGTVLTTDPKVQGAAVDLGIVFNDGKNLRAPDLAIGEIDTGSGWATKMPSLCVEYAGAGQDERELQIKIGELLERGVRYIWVVRLVGDLRVEVYERGQPLRVVKDGEPLRAEGALQNTYQVRDLVDRDAANEAALRNLLNRKGYGSLDDALQKAQKAGHDDGRNEGLKEGLKEGHKEGLEEGVLTLCEVLGIEVTDDHRKALAPLEPASLKQVLSKLKTTKRWPL